MPDRKTEAGTEASLEERRSRTLRLVAMAAAAPAVIAVIFIAYFVARAEIAHDEGRCPFHVVEQRGLSEGVRIVDEARRCQEGVVEHRWVVLRGGVRDEIGRRRLHDPFYDNEHYRWQAKLVDGEVEIDIQNDEVEPAHFREAPPEAR